MEELYSEDCWGYATVKVKLEVEMSPKRRTLQLSASGPSCGVHETGEDNGGWSATTGEGRTRRRHVSVCACRPDLRRTCRLSCLHVLLDVCSCWGHAWGSEARTFHVTNARSRHAKWTALSWTALTVDSGVPGVRWLPLFLLSTQPSNWKMQYENPFSTFRWK